MLHRTLSLLPDMCPAISPPPPPPPLLYPELLKADGCNTVRAECDFLYLGTPCGQLEEYSLAVKEMLPYKSPDAKANSAPFIPIHPPLITGLSGSVSAPGLLYQNDVAQCVFQTCFWSLLVIHPVTHDPELDLLHLPGFHLGFTLFSRSSCGAQTAACPSTII